MRGAACGDAYLTLHSNKSQEQLQVSMMMMQYGDGQFEGCCCVSLVNALRLTQQTLGIHHEATATTNDNYSQKFQVLMHIVHEIHPNSAKST